MEQTMVPTNQSHFAFESAGLDSAVRVSSFHGVEEISRTYRFVINLLSTNRNLDLDAVIGQPATLSLMRRDGEATPVHGVVADFTQKGAAAGNYQYEATLVPRLWLLSLSHQCRVFQNMKVDEIVSDVLKAAGFSTSDFRFSLRATLPVREYCVQYRESDLNFVQRLLEHEGIYYFFEQPANGGERVVFTDDPQQSPDIEGDRAIQYHSGAGLTPHDDAEFVREFSAQRQVVTGRVILKDYNYRTPETTLLGKAKLAAEMPGVYHDYGAHFKTPVEGERLARARSEEFDAQRKIFSGETGCPTLRAGSVFALTSHFRDDFNIDYLITGVEHEASQGASFGIGLNQETRPTYRVRFTSIPASTQFRPRRQTPIPRLSGVITARMETGGGDYAYIDDQGRYRVKLPFDLSDRTHGTASRAIRMAQPYSGPNYGMHFPNRADTEMVLACVDGDVDRPMGLSTVPNPSNTSPSISGNNPQCVIRSAGQNELTMDDTIGAENILLHGTKDWTITINHDKNQTVGNDETLSVKVDRSVTVGSNQTTEIGANHKRHVKQNEQIAVDANQEIHVKANRTKTVDANQTETIGGNKTSLVAGSHTEAIKGSMTQMIHGAASETVFLAKALSIGAAYQVTVGGAMNETVAAAKAQQIGGAKVVGVGLASTETVGIDKLVKAGASISEEAGAKFSIKSGGDFSVAGNAKGIIDIKDQLVLRCGSASITMKSSGDIVIKGAKITVNGSSDVVVKGTKVAAN